MGSSREIPTLSAGIGGRVLFDPKKSDMIALIHFILFE